MLTRLVAVALLCLPGETQEPETRKPGSEAPAFELTALDGRKMTSAELQGDAKEKRVVVLVFWSCRCPWVEHWNPTLVRLMREFEKQPRVRFAVVDSDRNETADPAGVRAWLSDAKLELPVFLDPENKVADAFGALVTPHCFVIGSDRKLVYTGRIDDAPPFDTPSAVRSKDETPPPPVHPLLRSAIVAALDGKRPEVAVDTPMGCRIKRH